MEVEENCERFNPGAATTSERRVDAINNATRSAIRIRRAAAKIAALRSFPRQIDDNDAISPSTLGEWTNKVQEVQVVRKKNESRLVIRSLRDHRECALEAREAVRESVR
jgi:hypothetical protein